LDLWSDGRVGISFGTRSAEFASAGLKSQRAICVNNHGISNRIRWWRHCRIGDSIVYSIGGELAIVETVATI
jgi:nuclear transport factor 2 (NTF2) superfamily protein